jgi:signal transduction histidine kinase
MVAMAVSTMLLGYYIFRINRNTQKATSELQQQNRRLAIVLELSKTRVWLFNTLTDRYTMVNGNGRAERTIDAVEFSKDFRREDFVLMHQELNAIREGRKENATCRVSGRRDKHNERETFDIDLRVLERSADGHPTTIIGLQHNITKRLRKREQVNKLLLQFSTIFNSSIIDMMYYDKDGRLMDINSKACQTFGINNPKELLNRGMNLKDVPAYQGLDIKNFDSYRMSSITDIDKIRNQGLGRIGEITIGGKIYYDTIVNAIRNDQGELTGIYTSGRCINEMVESYQRLQESTKMLKAGTKHIQDYIDNINYALQVSKVRLMNYRPETHVLELFTDINNRQYELSQMRCIGMVSPEFRRQVKGLMRRMDRRRNTRIDVMLRTVFHDSQQRDIWLLFHFIPMLQPDGTVSHYFGMCRNATEMVAMEEQLKKETLKAHETEMLKDSFLKNMSYEIRTPLNAVLGFAELLNNDPEPKDETVFIEYIKENTSQLLTLVNDILFISRLDAHMIEFKREPTDFAMLFESYCYMGWTKVREGVKTVVENPYDHLVIDIDEAHLADVIQKLCSCAAFFTHEGYIRTKYDYRRGKLTIVVEDTGVGIDKSTMGHLFERFVKNENGEHCGTGLVLPIIQELTRQMGGEVDFQSESGKGSTAWVTIPCTATTIEKKVVNTLG